MKKYTLYGFLLLFILMLTSCATLEDQARDILKSKHGMNEYEADTGAAQVVLMDKVKKDPNGKLIIETDENGNSGYVIDHEIFTIQAKKEKIEQLLAETKKWLDPRQTDPGSSIGRFLRNYPAVKERLQKQVVTMEEALSRYTRICQFIEFSQKMGVDIERMENFKKWKNDNVVLYPGTDLEKEINFLPNYVEQAIKDGKTRILRESILESRWDEKTDNPDYPNKDKINKTLWVTKEVKIKITAYDVNEDKECDYLHVFRLNSDGSPEKYPIIAIYHTINGNTVNVLAMDLDRPGHPSFGIPDRFEIAPISSVEEFFTKKQDTLKTVLNGRDEEKKFIYNEERMKTYFCQPGTIKTVKEEINEKGWDKPIDYAHGEFQVFIKYKKLEMPKKEDGDKKISIARQIEWIALQYHQKGNKYADINGRVVEFYRPNDTYRELSFDGITIRKTMLELFIAGKPSQRILIQYLMEKDPFQIDFDEGEQRITIIDKDNNGTLETRTMQKKPRWVEIPSDVQPEIETSPYSYGGH